MPQQPTISSNADWDSVTVLRKSKPSSKELKSSSVINRAMATGNVEISRKSKRVKKAYQEMVSNMSQCALCVWFPFACLDSCWRH
jgi:hypothetical protein